MALVEEKSPLQTGTDDTQAPQKKHSSAIIMAAQKMKFDQQMAKDKVERKNKKKGKKRKLKFWKKEKEGEIDDDEAELRKSYTTEDHELTREAIAEKYNIDLEKGLSNADVEKVRLTYGLNQLTPKKKSHWLVALFGACFHGFFNKLLWFGSVLCFIAYGVDPNDIKDVTNLYLGIVLAVVVFLTGCFGYYQESKSSDIMEAFATLKPKNVTVTRGGQPKSIDPVDLVPGDVVELEQGMKIPADIRIVQCTPDMKVNNSSLTGESLPITRKYTPSSQIPLEAENLAFYGTLLVKGVGKGVIIKTGDETFMGRIAKIASDTEVVETPIAKEIRLFVIKISVIAAILGISFFAIGMANNGDLIKNVIFLIGIIVANVPEGLLATVTVSLTLTARRMATKNVQVKNLESVETLGSTSVICSDKTGTLTTNVMTVRHVYYNGRSKLCDTTVPLNAVKGEYYKPGGKEYEEDFLRLCRIATLCNNTKFIETENGQMETTGGNATEEAMLKFASGQLTSHYKESVRTYRQRNKKLHEIPFNSANKWQISIHKLDPDFTVGEQEQAKEPQALIVIKGATERVLNMCDRYMFENETRPMTKEIREQVLEAMGELGAEGERVLSLAELLLDPEEYNINTPEPLPPKLTEDTRDVETDDVIFVQHENETMEIKLTGKTDQKGNPLSAGGYQFRDVFAVIEDRLGIRSGAQRLYFNRELPFTEGEECLGDHKIEAGSVLQLLVGPYTFGGTSREAANFPFNRGGKDPGFVFLGLNAMIDPPRPGVPMAVHHCQTAGIKVCMVTGDHPVTAHAIAKMVGIIRKTPAGFDKTKQEVADEKYGGDVKQVQREEYKASVVPGWVLTEALDQDTVSVTKFWNEVLSKPSVVFARTSPEQKLLIVAACQERGGIVAVTGDGVNDSPALKKADIGVAMGITGTDVAKESADMILLDDNFASIVNGVEEGRIIFDNLKKSIAYTLSSNIPEIAPFLLFQVAGVPLPLTTVMILLIDLGTDLAPAISMAHETAESDIMNRPPRDPETDNLVTYRLISFSYLQIGMLQALAGFFTYFLVLHYYGLIPRHLIGLSRDGTYEFTTNQEIQRSAYWLQCFDSSYHDQCVYMPYNFWKFDDANRVTAYDDWFGNGDDYTKDFRKLVKEKLGREFTKDVFDTATNGSATNQVLYNRVL